MKSDGLTIKQEKFALKYVETGNASEAYRYAYAVKKMTDKSVHEEACRLAATPKVSSRINELKEDLCKKNEITLDYITEGLKRAVEIADNKSESNNLRAAFVDIAKLHGLYVDRKVVQEVPLNRKNKAIAQRAFERWAKNKTEDV